MKIELQSLKCIHENINLEEYIDFREYIKSTMENPEWLRALSKTELEEMLKKNTKVWIYYNDEEPVCSMLAKPACKETIEKYRLDLIPNEVIEYGSMIVNPKYIGNGLQYQMLLELDKFSIESNYKYTIGTIHPLNTYSIKNIMKNGFELVHFKELDRGPRNIYLKYLNK